MSVESHKALDVARAVAQAIREVPGVAYLSSGRFAEAATYGSQDKVQGVIVAESPQGLRLKVHLIAAYSPTMDLATIAQGVRARAQQVIEGLSAKGAIRIDVAFDDLAF